jgi:hypothetical protein
MLKGKAVVNLAMEQQSPHAVENDGLQDLTEAGKLAG